ncbi:hypothetical protein [Nocardia anaemiae]|uniref:hypothetical protein n=1 Tax=Nocardia anaemiae TaxID=263910 RepID=UPI0012F528A0|nr:hypothetical protein [Nocardia anaemiae]
MTTVDAVVDDWLVGDDVAVQPLMAAAEVRTPRTAAVTRRSSRALADRPRLGMVLCIELLD